MHFYNPFKPHIVSVGDKYALRKLGLFGWGYKSTTSSAIWHHSVEGLYEYCLVDTLERAEQLQKVIEIKFVKQV